MILAADAVITGAVGAGPGWVRLERDRIAEVGQGAAPGAVDVHAEVLLPGFVDLHMHGGGGHDVAASAEQLAGAVEFHLRHGSTGMLASLVAAPVDALCTQLSRIADAVEAQPDAALLGAHLEGPFLAQARCGAQNPRWLRAPDSAVVADLLAAARGHLRCVTIAPELDGALEVIETLVSHGVVAAIGHTDATYAQARAAIECGASLITHAFNGMRPLHHREPGPVPAAIERGVACEVINDGLHVHDAVLRGLQASGRPALVTDAIMAAGVEEGDYELGGQPIRVRAGEARVIANGSLAGSTLTMDIAVRRAVAAGLTLAEAAVAAATTPAAVLGLSAERGAIAPGRRADLVLLDAGLNTRAVVTGGALHALQPSEP